MIILVIGPSGVGKSDYGMHVAESVAEYSFVDLDGRVGERWGIPAGQMLPKIGNDAFLDRCRDEVQSLLLGHVRGVVAVVVGAGALQSSRAGDWLSEHPGPTIAVVAPPEEVYRRGGRRNLNRTLVEFEQTEYSQYRLNLYGAAKHHCDVTGLSLADARAHFTAMIRDMVPHGC